MVPSSHSVGSLCPVSNFAIILGDNVYVDDLYQPHCSLIPQFKDLHLHLTVVHFLDPVIVCSSSDTLNSLTDYRLTATYFSWKLISLQCLAYI